VRRLIAKRPCVDLRRGPHDGEFEFRETSAWPIEEKVVSLASERIILSLNNKMKI